MKFSPMIAALALCSAAAGAPLGASIDTADSSPEPMALTPDLAFNSEEVDQSVPQEPQSPLITTDITTDAYLSDDELASVETADNSVPASEPPPVTSIALGITFLGAAGFIRRTRKERHRSHRRRLVHMRAIIAPR